MKTIYKHKELLEDQTQSLLSFHSVLAQKKEALALRVCELDSNQTLKPSFLKRLTAWMGQLAHMKSKEMDIISQLDALERKHAQLRKTKKVRMVVRPANALHVLNDDEPTPKDRSGLWLVLLLMMFSSKKNAPSSRNG